MRQSLYDFRLKMLAGNPKGIADGEEARSDEFLLLEGIKISIPSDTVVMTAGRDFADFMFTSMGVPVMLTHDAHADITINVDETYGSYKSYSINVSGKGVSITAHDMRGAAQAIFRLEERMTQRRYPCLSIGTEEYAPLYSPRMTHSGYGLDMYPDEHLLQIVKSGMDAILVFYDGINSTPRGFLDYNELIFRASRYGLDVYAYSYVGFPVHPDDPGARETADRLYAELLRTCPGIKSIILVGETINMPTKDPKASPKPYYDNKDEHGIPYGIDSGDKWPCNDYPRMLQLISEVVRAVKPDIDIVFWSYNWERAAMEDRIACIEKLPADITLMVTFERFKRYDLEGAIGRVADYTLAYEGPSEVFITEAAAAKRRGLKLYSMTNTAGATWDMGVMPYLPMPQQWIKRYRAMEACREKYGLCGLMESHHYGFWPSFVSRIAKRCFEQQHADYEALMDVELNSSFGCNADIVRKAVAKWSEAITHYIPSDEDQYGAFRIGPAYPFNLEADLMSPLMPNQTGDFAYHKYTHENTGRAYPAMIRIMPEIHSLEKMKDLIEEGQAILEGVQNPNNETEDLINLGRFLVCYVNSGLNAKKWHVYASRMQYGMTVDEVLDAADECEALIEKEYRNVEAAIPCVIRDSRLGFEPRMEYRASQSQLEWKLRQLVYVRDVEIKRYRDSVKLKIEKSIE